MTTKVEGKPTPARGGWYVPRMKRLTMDKWGEPDMFFEAVDPNSMLYGELEDLLEMRAKAATSDDEAPRFIADLVHRLFIGEWNLTDPLTGDPLKPPKEDPNSYKRLPTEVIMDMVTMAMGAVAEDAVPPESGSEP